MQELFSETGKELIVQAIRFAEQQTSGEIRIHIEAQDNGNAYDRAVEVFHQLNMTATQDRNGVLIYIAHSSKTYAIIGDSGIHAVAGINFWEKINQVLKSFFARGLYAAGIVNAVLETGYILQKEFPYSGDDKNELSDEISIK